MGFGLVTCSHCKEKFVKDYRHINENLKFGHNFFCSPSCQYRFKDKRITLVCNNLECPNTFRRSPCNTSPHNFCSRSCAAVFNNAKKWGVQTPKIILSTQERKERKIAKLKMYWANFPSKYTQMEIILVIQKFVEDHNRIPVKREMWLIYKPARKYFGTWNNAVEASGFKPNPVRFAEHHIAQDGHMCDSLAEKIIDDYLSAKGVTHERNVSYPEGEYTVDFKIDDKFIEYFGLSGELKRYDELKKIKKRIAKKYKLNLIEIYPKDLYPRHRLDEIFGIQ